jgi:two-component system LytT family response regulator
LKIRTLIVDDEPLARERLRTLLAVEEDIEVIGESGDGRTAVGMIRKLAPDLVFLDVQMPELDGFGVLEALKPGEIQAIVFVTAYDEYALRAFDVRALDYLLKPFDRARFHRALSRARADLRGDREEIDRRLRDLLEEFRGDRQGLERIVIKSSGRVIFLRSEEIDWIEAAGNYVKLHAGDKAHLLRETMKGIEEKLDARTFVRVHRSRIVNLDRVRELQPWFHGEYVITLEDGTELTSGRSYSDTLQNLLANR